jgi:hypothetical protein
MWFIIYIYICVFFTILLFIKSPKLLLKTNLILQQLFTHKLLLTKLKTNSNSNLQQLS